MPVFFSFSAKDFVFGGNLGRNIYGATDMALTHGDTAGIGKTFSTAKLHYFVKYHKQHNSFLKLKATWSGECPLK